MTNGSSQGLFVVVAVVIFGVFVFMSYLLFRDTLKPSLANVYCESFNQVADTTDLIDYSDNCDTKFSNSFYISRNVTIGFIDNNNSYGTTSYPEIWSPTNDSTRTINLNKYIKNGADLVIENGEVAVSTLSDNGVYVKQEALDKGFGNNKYRQLYVSINGGEQVYLKKSDFPNTGWGKNMGLKLKVGQVNTIKMTYVNVHGGKTTYTIKVNIINE